MGGEEIKVFQELPQPFPVKEMPSPLRTEGDPLKDQLPIFVSDYALNEAHSFLDEASFRTGDFKEGNFFSQGGGGEEFGIYKRHKGYYVVETTKEQREVLEKIKLLEAKEPSFEEAVRRIREVSDKNKRWSDLEPEPGKEEEKTKFFNNLKAVFRGIPELKNIEEILALVNNPLARVFAQYPTTALILGRKLVGEEREVINMVEVVIRIKAALSRKEDFSAMGAEERETLLAQLTRDFGEYLWGVGLIRGKGSREQRREHARLLLENTLTAYPEIGERVAEKIGEWGA